jgi:hypothetical protein
MIPVTRAVKKVAVECVSGDVSCPAADMAGDGDYAGGCRQSEGESERYSREGGCAQPAFVKGVVREFWWTPQEPGRLFEPRLDRRHLSYAELNDAHLPAPANKLRSLDQIDCFLHSMKCRHSLRGSDATYPDESNAQVALVA